MINTEKEYKAILIRVENLLEHPNAIENTASEIYEALNVLSDLIADYEERIFPVSKPNLTNVIKLRMAELGLNQKRLSEVLGISTPIQ